MERPIYSAHKVMTLYGRFTVTNPVHPLYGQVIEGKVVNTNAGKLVEYHCASGNTYRLPFSSLDVEVPLYEPNLDSQGYFSIEKLVLLEKVIQDLRGNKNSKNDLKGRSNNDQGTDQQ